MMRGIEATNNPAAGIGTPLKLFVWLVLILNFAKRHAPAAVKINAGNKAIKAGDQFGVGRAAAGSIK